MNAQRHAKGFLRGPALDWDAIDLVVFDVDGTLYDARQLRGAMARRLALDALRARSLRTLWVLKVFRQVREELAEEGGAGFLEAQYARTAQRAGCGPAQVRALVHEWMERRPLPLLPACRHARVDRLFEALRAAGKRVAVLSDYPAHDKLAALGLRADPVVCAHDPQVARLKPDPRGLRAILDATGVPAHRALMIGDRFDRDAAAAQRAGMRALVRSRRAQAGVPTFRRFDDPVFAPLLARAAG